jgi:hypothetical protein
MLGTMELYGRNASVVYGFKKLQGQSVYSWSLRLFSLVDVIKINQSINLCHVKDEQVSSLAKSKRTWMVREIRELPTNIQVRIRL